MAGKEKTPVKPGSGEVDIARQSSSTGEVDAFVRQVRQMTGVGGAQRGRLIFAMDATMSREHTWDMALAMQADMFREVASLGGLDVQLVFFRGFGECHSSKWVADPEELARLMSKVSCRGGQTQIAKVLGHAGRESAQHRVGALVYVGDSMEENVDELCQLAGEIGLKGVRVFIFQEGQNGIAERAFREIARLSGGAYSRFDAGSAAQLRELLRAVAVYAAGGQRALADFSATGKGAARVLLEQLD